MKDGRSAARGYALAALGAALFSLNGSMARYLLDDGVDAARLSQLRSAGSWLLLLIILGVSRRDLLRVDRAELPSLALLGVFGLAAIQASFFLAIDRLEIGPALTIQYLAPLLLLVWLRVVHGRQIAAGLWGAVALSLAGCFLVVRAYDAGSLDLTGVLAAFGVDGHVRDLHGRLRAVGPAPRAGDHAVLGLRLRDALLGASSPRGGGFRGRDSTRPATRCWPWRS